jgi:hypothetical protein
MPGLSIAMAMFLEPFKAAAANGAVVELKLRLLAGKVPAFQKYAHEARLENIEDDLAAYFSLPAEDREILRLCRQLRNKVLHSDFRAARGKLNEMGVATVPGSVTKVDVPVVTVAALSAKIQGIQAGTEGVAVAETSSADGGVYGWFNEAGTAGDFQQASAVFKRASAIVDRLADIENVPTPK